MKRLIGAALCLALFPLISSCKKQEAHVQPTLSAPQPAATVAPAEQRHELTVTIESPYAPKAHMYRGQLHAHTTNSDGTQKPAEVVAAYKRAGYGFVAITDHNWITADPGVPGIVFIQSVENNLESSDDWKRCHHENRIGAKTYAPGLRMPQEVIDRSREEDGFVQINHPDWPGSYPKNPCWSDTELLNVRRYDAVELWNASDDDSNNNAEPRVDYLLSHGQKTFVTAVDDCHDVRSPYCMTASVNVFADRQTREDIMANLKAGNFYASSGALISAVAADGPNVSVTLPKSCDVDYVVKDGQVAKTEHGVTASSYKAIGGERYVRVRVRCADRKWAWSNPFYVTLR